MTLSLRRGQSSDATALFALASQYQTGREAITRDEFLIALDNVLKPRDHETNVLFVAEEDGVVVGYSLMTVSRLLHAPGLTAQLQEIVVAETARGSGIGGRLVQANEQYCKRRGVRQLSASAANIAAFYARLEFANVGEQYRKVLDLG